jgi:hypothetical protein
MQGIRSLHLVNSPSIGAAGRAQIAQMKGVRVSSDEARLMCPGWW